MDLKMRFLDDGARKSALLTFSSYYFFFQVEDSISALYSEIDKNVNSDDDDNNNNSPNSGTTPVPEDKVEL